MTTTAIKLFVVGTLFLNMPGAFAKVSNETMLVSDDFAVNTTSTADDFSGEGSGEASGEGSGQDVIIAAQDISLYDLQQINNEAEAANNLSQVITQQANTIIAEVTALASNAYQLQTLSELLSTNSNSVLLRAEASLNKTEPQYKTCQPLAVCYNDLECGTGKCIGAYVGTCNCAACIDFWNCQTDSSCGGLQGSCNNQTAMCDCNAGFASNGFETFLSAFQNLCNVKKCSGNPQTDSCFGLPCNNGHCSCV